MEGIASPVSLSVHCSSSVRARAAKSLFHKTGLVDPAMRLIYLLVFSCCRKTSASQIFRLSLAAPQIFVHYKSFGYSPAAPF